MKKYPMGTRSDYQPPHFAHLIVLRDFPALNIHEYANIGPLDVWTFQIVSLITDYI